MQPDDFIAYYNQGFFNVSKAHNEKFGIDKSLIKIQIGENPEDTIQGYINRTANSNGTPRIMGGKVLTEWIKKHYKQGDLMKIDILSNDSIKLNKNMYTFLPTMEKGYFKRSLNNALILELGGTVNHSITT